MKAETDCVSLGQTYDTYPSAPVANGSLVMFPCVEEGGEPMQRAVCAIWLQLGCPCVADVAEVITFTKAELDGVQVESL